MERAAFTIYLIILILSILLFGAVHTYVYTLMTLGVLTGAMLLVIKNIRKDHRNGVYQVVFPKTSLDVAFLVLLAFLILQITPLPGFVLGFLSPDAAIVWEESWPAASLVGGCGKVESWLSLAPYHYPVRMSIIRFTVYGLFFLGFIRVLNSQKRIELTISLILAVGCFEALYGLIQAYSGSPQVLWFKSITDRNAATGTYINRNHFAGFMAMGMLLAAAYSAALSERKREKPVSRKRKISFRARISEFLSGEQLLNKRILILFAGVVMGIGLIFSASRGGIVSAAGALLCISLFFVFKKGQRRKGIIFLILFLITAAYALDIGVDYVVGRFKTIDKSYEERSRLGKKSIEMFEDYKVAGVGVGNFKYAYPKYQAVENKKTFVRFAHNDWAQFLSEAGIIGMVLLLVCMSYYLYLTIRLWRKREDPFAVCLGIAPIAALTAIGIHSFSDFNLHIPANFLILVVIMAIGYAALHLERHHRRDRMAYRYYNLPLRYRGAVVLVLIFGLIGWSGWWTIKHFMAEAYCNTVPNSTLNRDLHPPLEEIVKAIEWDGGNAEYHYKFAESREQRAGSREKTSTDYADYAEKKKQDQKEIIGALEGAVRLNPFDAQYHLRLGWEYAHLWKEPDYHTQWLPAADISMDRAAYFAGVKNPHLHQELGNYWTMRSKSVYPNNPVHHSAWAKACRHYGKAQSLETGGALKRMKKEVREYVWNFYPDEDMVKQVIPFRLKAPVK
ncbi:MAG: O-antigen ligase family protein [Thermodesulfobacteriota bacterium]|nr:O-antigen ligase family protein [Thermodesulfobacteriota bacterium]